MQRVEGVDVMFLYGETPGWHMHVSSLTVVDRPDAPDGFPASVRSLLLERLPLALQFRCRLHNAPFGLDHPVLVDDADFDPDRHIHGVALPRPGTRRQLGELTGILMAAELDRSAPLWELWVIEGLEGGGFAVLTKMHHALIDGSSGVDLVGILTDPEPVPRYLGTPPPPRPEMPPSAVRSAARAARETVATPLRTMRYAGQLLCQGALGARQLLQGTAAGLPFQTARSSLNHALTPRRTLALADVGLGDVRQVAASSGVKINDVILALVSGALRSYLAGRGEVPGRSLVAEVPVSIRTDATRKRVGTEVANMFVSLATDVEDPIVRLQTIARSSREAKELQKRLAARKRINLSDVAPPALLGAAVRVFTGSGLEGRIPPIFSLVVSSVPGPTTDLYLAGARVSAVYPMGPLLYASGLNVTALSIGDGIHFGLLACPDIVADPWLVADGISRALGELVDAVQARPGRRGVGVT